MTTLDSVPVHRPRRWDEPLDPHMTDADVDWLLTRMPFAGLDASRFPKSIPLDGVLKNDCRLHRFVPGEVIVREGDYANSAFLVLEGIAELITRPLPPEVLGRREVQRQSWPQALWQFLRPSGVREARDPHDVTPGVEIQDRARRNDHSVPQPTLFLQDFAGVVQAGGTARLVAGELFGEIAAMLRGPHSATVVAGGDATLLEIRLQGLKMLHQDAGFAQRMEDHYREHWLAIHLREVPLLRFVPETNLQNVVEHTQLRSFGRLQWNTDYAKTRKLPPAAQIESEPIVAQEGHQVTDLIVVRSGFGRVCQSYGAAQRTTAYLGKGHVFGLEEMTLCITQGRCSGGSLPLQNSLRAVGFLDTLHIPVECFAREILPHIRRSELPPSAAEAMLNPPQSRSAGELPPRERRDTSRVRENPTLELPIISDANTENRKREDDQPVSRPQTWEDLPSPTGTSFEPTGLLEFIVQNRFNNGRQAMIIDLHRCTRCDECVKACADVHDGNPRFARVGRQHERLQIVQACMHCTDPVCMIGCPTGALHRDEATGLVHISENICIGCGICVKGCPYGNIEMVAVSDRKGRAYLDDTNNKPILKATKCDMCSGLPSGPACVAACPHDALVRIDLSDSPPLDAWLLRRI